MANIRRSILFAYFTMLLQLALIITATTTTVIATQTGEIVRQFSVLPIDPATGKAVILKANKHTGLFNPIIKHACFDKVVCVQLFVIIPANFIDKIYYCICCKY